MRVRLRQFAHAIVAFLFVASLSAAKPHARAITWVRSVDALTLDPHAHNEGATNTLSHQIYEPLIIRDAQGKQLPALAESWGITSDPLVWEFRLRKNVTFHDGTPFTVDDVIFSFDRARQPTSDVQGQLAAVDRLVRVDDHTLRIKTKQPSPIFTSSLSDVFIVSKVWAEANKTVQVQNFKISEDTFAARNANGTGPFILVSREPDVKTVLKRNDRYWSLPQRPVELTDVTLLPIKADAARVASLLSGETDFVQDLGVGDLEKLGSAPKLQINVGAENRAIFLGLNVGEDELRTSDIKGRNPFADKRVRQAMNMTINRTAIQRTTMRGQSLPTGTLVPPGVNGYTKEIDVIQPLDIAKAKALMAEAGLPDGFSVAFLCSNDRYLNDEAICRAISEQLAAIGIRANVVSQPRSILVPLLQVNPPQVDFYLHGLAVPTFDSHYILSSLYHSRTKTDGLWNASRYANPDTDKMIEGLTLETDLTKRNQSIAQIWKTLTDETIYIPLHVQTLAYAMKADIDIPVDVSNQPKLKFVKLKKTQ